MKIVLNAKAKNRKKTDGVYYERHHILPKSIFPAWKNRKGNIVLLTAREHYFCHELLLKIYPSRAMNYALWMLSNSKYHDISPRQYEKAKLLNYQNSLGKSNPNFGKRWTDEQKRLASIRTKSQIEINGNPNTGNSWSDKQKELLRSKKVGRHFYTNGVIDICVTDDKVPNGFTKGHCKSFDAKTDAGIASKKKHGSSMSHSNTKGLKWYHNTYGENILSKDCPEGFIPGRFISEEKLKEMKSKNSISNKNRKHPTSLVIKNLDTGEVYNGLKEAALACNISVSMVSAILGKRRNSNIRLELI